MNIHHDTSFKSILEDDSISLASRVRICSCSGKGAGLWLIARPSICSFHIAQFTFNSALRFHFSLIQPSTSNFLMCECGHGLDAFSTHLTHCMFGGQPIATHDTIRNIMYAFTQENGHNVWRKWWYTLTLRISLRTDFYMIHENQVFVANVVVIDST
jgi:hypothetical protein